MCCGRLNRRFVTIGRVSWATMQSARLIEYQQTGCGAGVLVGWGLSWQTDVGGGQHEDERESNEQRDANVLRPVTAPSWA